EHALFRVAVAARAFGLAAIDGPYAVLGDETGLRAAAERSRAFGYDGKWCIHPAQIAVCNAVFTPTGEEVERARRILAVAGVARPEGGVVAGATRRRGGSSLARLGE